MNVPSLIQNSPDAIREFNRLAAELGCEDDPRLATPIALYAQIYVDTERLQTEVEREGAVIVRPSGVRTLNPKARLLAAHRKQLLSAARALRMTPATLRGKTQHRPRLRALLHGAVGQADPSLL